MKKCLYEASSEVFRPMAYDVLQIGM